MVDFISGSVLFCINTYIAIIVKRMSDSSCSEEDGNFLKVRSPQKFPPEVSDSLERLYANGMTDWGMDYSNDVELAVKSTGLSLSQVKVMAVKSTGLSLSLGHYFKNLSYTRVSYRIFG